MTNETTNTQNYQARYDRIAHLATPEMKAFHKYLHAETIGQNGYRDWTRLDGLGIESAVVKHFSEIDALSNKVVVDKGYSGHKFEGKSYRQTENLDVVELAKLMRQELAATFPAYEFSVKTDKYSMGQSIDVRILYIDFNPLSDDLQAYLQKGGTFEEFVNVQHWHRQRDSIYNPEYVKFYDKVKKIQSQYNFDDSDAMTDYFHVKYYGSVSDIGVETYLRHAADPSRREREKQAEREEREKQAEGAAARKKALLDKIGDYKRDEWAWYVAPRDNRYKYWKEGDLVPCKIRKIPNGKARGGFLSFNVDLYLRSDNPALKVVKQGKFVDELGFDVFYYQNVEVAPEQLRPLQVKPAPALEPPKPVRSTPALSPAKSRATASGGTATIVHNKSKNGIEVKFSTKPAAETLMAIKKLGFQWSNKNGVWYHKYTEARLEAVTELLGGYANGGQSTAQTPESLPALQTATIAKEERTSTDQAKLAEQFIALANSKQKVADGIYNGLKNKLRNTPKRNKEADSQGVTADIMADEAQYYRAIGEAIKAGNLPPILAGIRPIKAQADLYLFVAQLKSGLGYYEAYRTSEPFYQVNKARFAEPKSYELVRAKSIGLKNYDEVDEAYQALQALVGGKSLVDPNAVKLAQLVNKWRFAKQPGFFPTPDAVSEQMVKVANIRPGNSILEPEGGLGDLAEVIRRNYPKNDLSVCETMYSLREILTLKGFKLVGEDFLQHTGRYNRIIMNPPFENGQDIDHVRHAHSLLKPGGWMVALMSEGPFYRSDKKATAFRDWLDERESYTNELPEGSFKSAFNPTGVRVRMVIIEKEGIEVGTPRVSATMRKGVFRKRATIMTVAKSGRQLATMGNVKKRGESIERKREVTKTNFALRARALKLKLNLLKL